MVQAKNHASGRAFGKAIHAEHADVDGLVYSSRLTGEDVYATIERSVEKLKAGDTGRRSGRVAVVNVDLRGSALRRG